MHSQRLLFLGFAFVAACLTGCASYPRAQNPLPGVYRIAVVDFVDKTNGSAGLDTRKVTEIFASELQKVPTFEVVPVQEVREVLGPQTIDTNQPQLAFELARAVHAQAIIIGSVNEYNAYYPPRVGLHCEMYAMITGQPEAIVQSPPPVLDENRNPLEGVVAPVAALVDPFQPGKGGKGQGHGHGLHKFGCGKCAGCRAGKACLTHSHGGGFLWKRHRFQTEITDTSAGSEEGAPSGNNSENKTPSAPSPDEVPVPREARGNRHDRGIRQVSAEEFTPSDMPKEGVTAPANSLDVEPPSAGGGGYPPGLPRTQTEFDEMLSEEPVMRGPGHRVVEPATGTPEEYMSKQIPDYQISVRAPIDPIPVVEPWVIRHSRVFDGTNLGLVRKLKDYYFFKRDIRGGEWQGYVMRNDDFTRFACNQMIYEMLEAAGGDWITLRGIRLPDPYYPWPPR